MSDDRSPGPAVPSAVEMPGRESEASPVCTYGPLRLPTKRRRGRDRPSPRSRPTESVSFDGRNEFVVDRGRPAPGTSTSRERVGIDLGHVSPTTLVEAGVGSDDPGRRAGPSAATGNHETELARELADETSEG